MTLIDYLLSKERDVQSREGREMALLEAKSLQMQLGTAVYNLYRHHKPKGGSSIPHSNEDDYIKYLYSYLSEEDFKDSSFRFHAKDITFFETEITNAIGSMLLE